MLIINKIFQNNRFLSKKARKNRSALKYLQKQGHPLPNIRQALLLLNSIQYNDLLDGVCRATISNTVKGKTKNKIAINNISRALNLKPDELFQDHDAL